MKMMEHVRTCFKIVVVGIAHFVFSGPLLLDDYVEWRRKGGK